MKEEKNTGKTIPSFVLGVVVIIIVALMLVVALRSLIKSNELSERFEVLQEQYEELEYENLRLKNELEKELDDETIKDIAQAELGLADPKAEYYYSD